MSPFFPGVRKKKPFILGEKIIIIITVIIYYVQLAQSSALTKKRTTFLEFGGQWWPTGVASPK